MVIEVTRKELQKILDLKKIEGFKKINRLLDGDLDLSVANLEGCDLVIEKDKVCLIDVDKDLKILERISSLNEEDHMKLYEKHGVFHDGGDDFDYGGGFVGVLYELLEEYLRSGRYARLFKEINDYKEQVIKGEQDIWEFIELLKKIPGVLDVELQGSDYPDTDWVSIKSMNDPNNKEFGYNRLKIQMYRGSRKNEEDIRVWLEIYGILGLMTEGYSGNVGPSFEFNSPMEEWTEFYINNYYLWYNHYGS